MAQALLRRVGSAVPSLSTPAMDRVVPTSAAVKAGSTSIPTALTDGGGDASVPVVSVESSSWAFRQSISYTGCHARCADFLQLSWLC
jgi:hypothetical protein